MRYKKLEIIYEQIYNKFMGGKATALNLFNMKEG